MVLSPARLFSSNQHQRCVRAVAFTAAIASALIGLTTGTAAANPVGANPVGRHDFTLQVGHTDPWIGGTRVLGLTAWYPTTTVGRSRYLADTVPSELVFAAKVGALLGTPMVAGRLVGRTVPAALDAPVTGSGLPVVIVSPGFGMPREFMSTIAANLASRGYVAVTISHTRDAMVARVGDDLVDQFPAAVDAAYLDRIIDVRMGDVRSVLDQLSMLPVVGAAIDTNRVAVLGHSYGGYAAIETAATDPRVRAAVALDSVLGLPGTRPSVAAERGVAVPTMHIGDVGFDDVRWGTFDAASAVPMVRYRMPGTAHMQFSDLCLVGDGVLADGVCGDTDSASILREVDVRVFGFLRAVL